MADFPLLRVDPSTIQQKNPTLRPRAFLLVLPIVAFALFWARLPVPSTPALFRPQPEVIDDTDTPSISTTFLTGGETREVHSVTAIPLPSGRLMAFWYGGSREGAGDVAIYSASYTPGQAPGQTAWSSHRKITDRAQAQGQLHRYIRKLGNPVVYKPSENKLWLFYVTVSVGGWAGSAINLMTSNDLGESWGASKRLVTSPFTNISTLVKGPGIAFDHGHGLPVYHEFIGKFGELLRLDDQGQLVRKERLSSGTHSLQPVIVPTSATSATGFMRYAGQPPGRILQFSSADGGASWSAPVKSTLPNPNSAVSVISLEHGELLMAFNNSEEERNDMTLALSRDAGLSWVIVAAIESAATGNPSNDPSDEKEYSYPWLSRSFDGRIHLLYTWHKKRIKHVRFNRAWLDGQLTATGEVSQ